MIRRLKRATLFALYQVTILLGIAAMPLALLARRAGLRLPLERPVRRLGDAYEETRR